MKLSVKQLRNIIRLSLKEVFEPSNTDYEEVAAKTGKDIDRFKVDISGHTDAKTQRRVAGLQTSKEIQDDRALMRQHQEKYKQGISEIYNAIKNGDITVMHSLTYAAGTMGTEGAGEEIFSKKSAIGSWLAMNGTSGNNSLSTVIFDIPYSQFKQGGVSTGDIVKNAGDRLRKGGSNLNAQNMAKRGVQGIILKGYPVISGKFDLGTQTMSAVPQALLKHQKDSGFSKRSDKYDKQDLITNLKELKDYGGTEETVLDNWQVVAPYMIVTSSRMLKKIKKVGIGSIKLNTDFIELFTNQKSYQRLYEEQKRILTKIRKDASKFEVHSDYFQRFNKGTDTAQKFLDNFYFDWYLENDLEDNYPDHKDPILKKRFYQEYGIDKLAVIKKKLEPIKHIKKNELRELMTYFKLLSISAKYKLGVPVII